jgi:RNA polymerase sigma-70 factor (ECF subfamily)
MHNDASFTDLELMQGLKAGDVKAFKKLFYRYYADLCRYAFRFIHQKETAEEIVSGMFSRIWEKREDLIITTSPKAYLYTAVKNSSFNYLKSQYARHLLESEAGEKQLPVVNSPAEELTYQELQAVVRQGIESLPERCRIIYTLSRQSGFTYEEIAAELGISPKTVKAQMGIALHKLRLYLDQHWHKMLMMLLPML